MHNLDMVVVGSGIGGSLISALNSDKNIALFEKDKNLGGCASTFKRFGNYYNTGATTLVGYEDGHVLKKHFDEINLKPNVTKSDIAIRVVQNGNVLDRVKDFETFLDTIERVYPNRNNRAFWTKIVDMDRRFWTLQKIYYAKYSLKKYLKTSAFVSELFGMFGVDMLKSAKGFIKHTLGDIPSEYQEFIDAQLLITVQSRVGDLSLLSLALGLSYPFHDVFYVNGGMGSLIEDILAQVEVHRDEEITKIIRDDKKWIVQSQKGEYRTDKLILNSSIYQSANLFEDKSIKRYYNSFSFSDQSAFVLYLSIDIDKSFLEHYQFIFDESIPNAISNSFFVSFSQKEDTLLSPNGRLSVTISTHTKALFWRELSKIEYEKQKMITEHFIMEKFLEYFTSIKRSDISQKFSATSSSFNRYINRYNCGGKAIGFKNFTQLPSTNTPFEGLYSVGDTVFAGQGWPGVALGVEVLNKELKKLF